MGDLGRPSCLVAFDLRNEFIRNPPGAPQEILVKEKKFDKTIKALLLEVHVRFS